MTYNSYEETSPKEQNLVVVTSKGGQQIMFIFMKLKYDILHLRFLHGIDPEDCAAWLSE